MDGSTTIDAESFSLATNSLGAAAATANAGVDSWIWLVLAGLILIGVGIWALRQPVV